jgi:hypothetical protein
MNFKEMLDSKANLESYGKEVDKSDNLENILAERGKEYGDFKSQSELSQRLKMFINSHLKNYPNNLSLEKFEALEMIVHKISRIINGNPNNIDSWRDICGYSQLLVKELEKESAK